MLTPPLTPDHDGYGMNDIKSAPQPRFRRKSSFNNLLKRTQERWSQRTSLSTVSKSASTSQISTPFPSYEVVPRTDGSTSSIALSRSRNSSVTRYEHASGERRDMVTGFPLPRDLEALAEELPILNLAENGEEIYLECKRLWPQVQRTSKIILTAQPPQFWLGLQTSITNRLRTEELTSSLCPSSPSPFSLHNKQGILKRSTTGSAISTTSSTTLKFKADDDNWTKQQLSIDKKVWSLMLDMCVTTAAEASAKDFRRQMFQRATAPRDKRVGSELVQRKVRKVSTTSSIAASFKSTDSIGRTWKRLKGLVKPGRKETWKSL